MKRSVGEYTRHGGAVHRRGRVSSQERGHQKMALLLGTKLNQTLIQESDEEESLLRLMRIHNTEQEQQGDVIVSRCHLCGASLVATFSVTLSVSLAVHRSAPHQVAASSSTHQRRR